MDESISVGPAQNPGEKRETRATTEGVDAQNANEFDIEHGLAGVEAKPFSPAANNPHPRDDPDEAREHEARQEGQGLVSERRTPGRDDGVNASTAGTPKP